MSHLYVSKLSHLTYLVAILAISILTNRTGALVLSHALSFTNLNATMHRLSLDIALPICTDKTAWTLNGQGPGKAACAESLNMFETAIESFRFQAFEFFEEAARPNPQLRTVRTPRRLTWRERLQPPL